MADSRALYIRSQFSRCALLFRQIIQLPDIEDSEPWKSELEKLLVWRSVVGLQTGGSSSLEFRLEGSTYIRDVLRQAFDNLVDSLNEC
jgi:hypothetical protein